MSLYRIDYDGGFNHVEASSFDAAIAVWNACMVRQFGTRDSQGNPTGWSGHDSPESITLLDSSPVLR